jgi:molybdopterin-guanine dinucleotide biosynthesis protein A
MARGGAIGNCEGLLLCGGAGRRVGGLDKGLLPFAGTTAAEAVLAVLMPHCERVFISANRHLERYRDLAIGPVITDRRPGHAGPLAGLEAVAAATASDRLLVLPCDLPHLGRQVPETLLASLESDGDLDAVYASAAGRHHYLVAALRTRALATVGDALDGDLPRRLLERLDARPTCDLVFACAGGRDHYLIAALHRRALCSVTEQLEGGRGRVREWVEGLAYERLRLEGRDGALLRNRNTLDDWGLAAHFPTEPPAEETPRPSPRGR